MRDNQRDNIVTCELRIIGRMSRKKPYEFRYIRDEHHVDSSNIMLFAHLSDLMNVNLIVNARITLSTQYT